MPSRLLSVAVVAFLAHFASARPATSLPITAEGPAKSADSELARMGRQIPGFGGLFYDEQGRPNVYLLRPRGATAAALKRLGPQLQVRQGDYEFEHLLAWRHELRPLLGLPGVVLLDVDETRNRVVMGLDSTSRNKALDRDRVERRLLLTGVPRQAVVLREMGPIAELAALSLESKVRPAAGGVQIAFPEPPFFGICTLGFNAFSGKIFGFVVNAHCTAERGAVDGVRYVQSTPSGGFIGTEMLDPGFSTEPPCPPNRRCRFSDSAFAKYDKRNLGALGKIARPTSGGTDFGSTTLNPASARFTITGRQAPFVGDTVHKVGRTTGWTYGTVAATCADISSSSSDVTNFCQSVVQAASGGGDSGSPVFYRTGGKNNVKLVGILWGGGFSSQLGNIFVFSPLENIEAELGPLKVN